MLTSYLNFKYSPTLSSTLKLPAVSQSSFSSRNSPAPSPEWWTFPYFRYMIAKDNRRVKFGPITQILFDGSLSFPNPEQYYCSLFLHPELSARQKREEVNVEKTVVAVDHEKTTDMHLKWANFATEAIWRMLPKLPQKLNLGEDFKEFGYKLIKTTDCLGPVVIIMLKYVQRILSSGKDFDIYPYDPEFVLLVVGLILAHKWLEDSTYSNKSWSEMSGIPLELLGNMERDFLSILDNSIYISEQEYNNWLLSLFDYQNLELNTTNIVDLRPFQEKNNYSWPKVNFQSAVGAVNTELNKKKLEVDFSNIIDLITDDMESLFNENSPFTCPLTPKDNSIPSTTSKDFHNTFDRFTLW
ncbi:11134_t:CDS:2 [Funneliformis mosseae]|uniref:11134_t:CDS:1 n=1 Tax=Funneliformis mosseae TaxID=27381 RepID=A0A9N9AP64_FUNMO|nr:11134_t:CDS:2 [Funneliformis mosseae]